jgi:hypothetical protein
MNAVVESEEAAPVSTAKSPNRETSRNTDRVCPNRAMVA